MLTAATLVRLTSSSPYWASYGAQTTSQPNSPALLLVRSRHLHQPPSLTAFMPAYLSPICSLFAVCITAAKLIVPTWRLHYEIRSRKPTGKPISNNNDLWLDTIISIFFVLLSVLLLVFSFVGSEEKGLQVLLSLAGGLMIVYHGGYLSMFLPKWLHWLRWALLIFFFVVAIISIMIASSVGHTEALKLTLLSILFAVYLGMFGGYSKLLFRTKRNQIKFLFGTKVYGVKFLRIDRSKVVRACILWNRGFSCVACIGALASLVLYQRGWVEFITSLWIVNGAAMVWVVGVLWMQLMALQDARSGKEGLEPKDSSGSHEGRNVSQSSDEELGVLPRDLSRQDSMAHLVID